MVIISLERERERERKRERDRDRNREKQRGKNLCYKITCLNFKLLKEGVVN
jgi:hypothetical protein